MALERRAHTGPFGQREAALSGARAIHARTSRRVAEGSVEVLEAIPDGAPSGADLGGSSKYSNENFED